ncbi:MAG: arylesterase [Candidatus Sericytochromatia bacterium]|nr:arylesterase [Candidatus Sericytochromatia bacterium]
MLYFDQHLPTELLSDKPSGQKVITAFGDSLTAGYGLPVHSSYPSILSKKLKAEGYNYKVINAGLSGDTTAGGIRRVKWVINTKPDLVILELGANDALRGMSVPEAKANLSKIIEEIKNHKINILLCGMNAPRNLGEKYYKEFDSIYPDLAKKYHLNLIPFFLEGVALKKELVIEDGIHPNEKGYYKIVDNVVWKYLKPILIK